MFSKPRNLTTESELYEAATRALMRRARSVSEMKKVLIRRSDNEDLIAKVIARLKQSGLIDDARYAKQFARQRTQYRKQGKFRVARDLRARGVPDRHIEAALEEISTETDESLLIRQRIERKLKLLRGPRTGQQLGEKKIASLYRSLLRAGFSADAIRRELKSHTSNVPREIDSQADCE